MSDKALDSVHHIAITVQDVAKAVEWYTEQFRCDVAYQDDTWAMVQFDNLALAFVLPEQHPPHIGYAMPNAEQYGELKPHRDGTRSVYTSDPFGNVVEMMDDQSV